MKMYSQVYKEPFEMGGTVLIGPSLTYDYSPIESKYVNVAELLEALNKIEHITQVWTLVHNLTSPIPDSD